MVVRNQIVDSKSLQLYFHEHWENPDDMRLKFAKNLYDSEPVLVSVSLNPTSGAIKVKNSVHPGWLGLFGSLQGLQPACKSEECLVMTPLVLFKGGKVIRSDF